MFSGVDGTVGSGWEGKDFQKALAGGWLYSGRVGISGHFFLATTFSWIGG